MSDCSSYSHIQSIEVPQTGAIISRSTYFYNSEGGFIRVRHYGPKARRGR
jgi:hypothetical protein